MHMKKKNNGFTLIELLIVITIISILAGFVIVASRAATFKALNESTRGSILTLTVGCNEYNAIFRVFPDINDQVTLENNGYKDIGSASKQNNFNEDALKEFNKRLRFMLMDITSSNDEEIDGDVLVENAILISDDGTDGSGENDQLLGDAFGNFLRISPGRDHSGNTPQGPNNFNADNSAFNMLDIYSLGTDQEDGIIDFSNDTSTENFDLLDSDEIVSWNIEKSKKSKRN